MKRLFAGSMFHLNNFYIEIVTCFKSLKVKLNEQFKHYSGNNFAPERFLE